MENKKIHLVKASFHAQFKVAMERCGASAERYFKNVRLPYEVNDPESLLPVIPFFQLINTFAINENIPNFGAIVAETTPWHKVLSLGPLIKGSNNLKELLEQFCDVSNGQSSSVNFTFVDEGTDSSFCYRSSLFYKGDIQMEFYRISSMIQLVQLATGAGWRPATIRLLMPENALAQTCPLINSSEVHFSQSLSSISIPKDQLTLPVNLNIPESIAPSVKKQAGEYTEYVESINQIIDSYAQAGSMTIEDLAFVTDQTARTVQRRLKQAGLNFNDLFNAARYRHARGRLLAPNLSISEVAELLGYSNPAHFSRAFRRWSGLTPSAYKKSQQHIE